MIDNNEIDHWIRSLLNSAFSPRKLINTIENFNKEVVLNSLIRKLDDEIGSTRERAAVALGIISDDLAVDALIQVLRNDPDTDVRRQSAWALGEIKDPVAVFPLIKSLEDDLNWPVRAQAAISLGNIGDDLAAEFLIWSLKDPDWHVRKSTATALGNLGDERAIEPLIIILNDEDTDVRRKAMIALQKFGENSVKPLTEALKTGDPVIRMNSAEVLGKIGDSSALHPLISALDPNKKRDKNRHVRAKVAEALGKIGDDRAVNILRKEANNEFVFVRNKAQEALERIRSDGSSNKILKYNSDELYFEYPNSWVLISPSWKSQLLKGKHVQHEIEFSINKIKNEHQISIDELLEILREAYYSHEFTIDSETIYESQDMVVYRLFGLNNKSDKAIMILSYKLHELIYCVLFKGKIDVFDKLIGDINIIANSFQLNDQEYLKILD